MPQGGTASSNVTITRNNGFSGVVQLAASGAPGGITVTPNPPGVSGTAATLDVTVAASVSGSNNSFTLAVGANSGLAIVNRNGTNYQTTVNYFSGAEVRAMVTGPGPCAVNEQTGPKQLMGTVGSVGSPQLTFWTLALGGASVPHDPGEGLSFTLEGVADGARDLVAARTGNNGSNYAVQRMILRRATNYASHSAIPLLDFQGSESFAPVAVNGMAGNLGTDPMIATVALLTARGITASYFTSTPSPAGGAGRTGYGLRSEQRQPGEFHVAEFFATPTTGTLCCETSRVPGARRTLLMLVSATRLRGQALLPAVANERVRDARVIVRRLHGVERIHDGRPQLRRRIAPAGKGDEQLGALVIGCYQPGAARGEHGIRQRAAGAEQRAQRAASVVVGMDAGDCLEVRGFRGGLVKPGLAADLHEQIAEVGIAQAVADGLAQEAHDQVGVGRGRGLRH